MKHPAPNGLQQLLGLYQPSNQEKLEKLTIVCVAGMICSIILTLLLYVVIVMLWGVCECGEVTGEKAAEPLTTVWDCVSKSVDWPNVCDGGPRLFNWIFITKTVFLSQKPYFLSALTKGFFCPET